LHRQVGEVTLFDELVASLERGDPTALTQYLSALHQFHHY